MFENKKKQAELDKAELAQARKAQAKADEKKAAAEAKKAEAEAEDSQEEADEHKKKAADIAKERAEEASEQAKTISQIKSTEDAHDERSYPVRPVPMKEDKDESADIKIGSLVYRKAGNEVIGGTSTPIDGQALSVTAIKEDKASIVYQSGDGRQHYDVIPLTELTLQQPE